MQLYNIGLLKKDLKLKYIDQIFIMLLVNFNTWWSRCGNLAKKNPRKKIKDPQWVVSMKLEPITSSLTHFFWMSLKQQILWLHYHDVIMHDNTCKTNHYNRPLSIFVTPDNNLKTRIVAQAIVDDETQFSYEWVFQCVKKVTNH
jgi:hypothetical protein